MLKTLGTVRLMGPQGSELIQPTSYLFSSTIKPNPKPFQFSFRVLCEPFQLLKKKKPLKSFKLQGFFFSFQFSYNCFLTFIFLIFTFSSPHYSFNLSPSLTFSSPHYPLHSYHFSSFPSSSFIFVFSYSHPLTINLSLSILFYAQFSLTKKKGSLSLSKFFGGFFYFLYSLKPYFGLMRFSFVF